MPFPYAPRRDLRGLRVGVLESAFAADSTGRARNEGVLETLARLGAELRPVALPPLPVEPLAIILSAEAAAAFEELTLSGRDDLLVRQIERAWPNEFRGARLIPAVEYIQANRARSLLIGAMAGLFEEIDVFVAPPFQGEHLLLSNLTGHPSVVLPAGFDEEGMPASITFTAGLYDEATLLALARAYQEASGHHRARPPGPWSE
jgi:Asp-tRNA(Asn)/Glu-tRNA(Gln) amidotransferase A subunit family amidase